MLAVGWFGSTGASVASILTRVKSSLKLLDAFNSANRSSIVPCESPEPWACLVFSTLSFIRGKTSRHHLLQRFPCFGLGCDMLLNKMKSLNYPSSLASCS